MALQLQSSTKVLLQQAAVPKPEAQTFKKSLKFESRYSSKICISVSGEIVLRSHPVWHTS